MLTEDWRSEAEIKTRIAMGKEAFNKKRKVLCSSMDLELRKRLVKCYVWSVMLYGCETWTMGRKDKDRINAFEMWVWRRLERVKWVDKVRNEEVLERVGEERKLLKIIQKRKGIWIGRILTL